jgi:hypothetical protein
MSTAGYISFPRSPQPIREPVTKFGSNPVWLTKPEWPLSRRTGEPMVFIGQIALTPEIFGPVAGKMAYLFLAEHGTFLGRPVYDPNSYLPDAGANAVIVQPGDNSHHPTRPLVEGPSLFRFDKGKRRILLFRKKICVPCEYGVSLTLRDDPDQLDEDADDPYASIPHDMDDCKVGGIPMWIQDEEWPYPDSRRLLVQLVWGMFPFFLELGDAATLYAFLSRDGSTGKLLWQCY